MLFRDFFLAYLEYYKKALEILQKPLPPNHSSLVTSYSNIGAVYHNMGEYSKALSYFEHALDINQRSLPPSHPHIQITRQSKEIVKKKLQTNSWWIKEEYAYLVDIALGLIIAMRAYRETLSVMKHNGQNWLTRQYMHARTCIEGLHAHIFVSFTKRTSLNEKEGSSWYITNVDGRCIIKISV